MDILTKYTLAETSKFSEAEILFRNCPQDNKAAHADKITRKLKNGEAKLLQINKDGKEIGFLAVEIYNQQYYVLAMSSVEQCDVFCNVVPIFEEYARKMGCKCIAFSTVRPGLIKQSKDNGFIISEIVMRKYL